MKQRVADYMAEYLAEKGINNLFTVTGGGSMHLNDAFGRNDKIKCIYHHHEQACTIAAEGYARVKGTIGAACVTTGPGGTNALTGVLGAWLDSIPMLIISGQVKFETTTRSVLNLNLRQLGDQEFDITRCAQTMTKYAEMVTDPYTIKYHLDKALHLAQTGRPGPVWLDIPLDVQGATIDVDTLQSYNPTPTESNLVPYIESEIFTKVIHRLENAQRPIIYIGMGIHLSNSEAQLLKFAELYNIPVVAGFNAHDCIPYNHKLYIGRPGTIGDRAGNYAVQNADLLLILGCRMGIRQTGYAFNNFAREAYKIMVDIDQGELSKPTLSIDLPIHGDVNDFLNKMIQLYTPMHCEFKSWIQWCRERKERYPVVLEEYYKKDDKVNPYCFMETLSNQLEDDDIIVAANATACICSFQAMKHRGGQRHFSNSGAASMGYDIPAAIGACIANEGKRVISLAGDGSIQMNIQELQTIVHNNLPIIIFYLNNEGYHSIKQTQKNFFGDKLIGCDPLSGVSFPNIEKIAAAYEIPFLRCQNHRDLEECIRKTLDSSKYLICEVILDPLQPFSPKPSSVVKEDGKIVSRPLEDLYPFLSRDEYLSNMIIQPVEE